MKKLFFAFCILLNSVVAFSQEENIPAPDFVNSLYIITNSGLVALEKQEASLKSRLKLGTFVPYAGLFVGGAKSSFVIKGSNSTTRVDATNKLKLIYEPSVMIDPESAIKIIPFVSNTDKEQREVFTGSSNTWGTVKANEVPKVPFTYKKYKEKYIIIEISDLPAGEYGIVFSSMDKSNSEIKFQLFGVN